MAHAAELVATHGSSIGHRAKKAGIYVHSVSRSMPRLSAASKIRSILADGRIELVHANEAHAVTAAWLALWAAVIAVSGFPARGIPVSARDGLRKAGIAGPTASSPTPNGWPTKQWLPARTGKRFALSTKAPRYRLCQLSATTVKARQRWRSPKARLFWAASVRCFPTRARNG